MTGFPKKNEMQEVESVYKRSWNVSPFNLEGKKEYSG